MTGLCRDNIGLTGLGKTMETGGQVATPRNINNDLRRIIIWSNDSHSEGSARILLARDRRSNSYCSSLVDRDELGFVAPFSLFLVARGKYF